MPLIGALILFFIFAVNVGLGSIQGTTFLGDVGEMLVLLATAILFVVAILEREAAAKNAGGSEISKGGRHNG